jgi:hypothetical protein
MFFVVVTIKVNRYYGLFEPIGSRKAKGFLVSNLTNELTNKMQ